MAQGLKGLFQAGVVLGVVMMPGMFIGEMMTKNAMTRVHAILGQTGWEDLELRREAMRETMMFTYLGVGISAVGLILFLLCNFRLKHLRRTVPPPLAATAPAVTSFDY